MQNTFKRHELKYLMTAMQQKDLLEIMKKHMHPDEFGKSTICSIYFDTPNHVIIRRSMEKPEYKEKLRLRSYGVPSADGNVFAELKKKYKGIVYKRRIALREEEAMAYLEGKSHAPVCSQITKEIDYFLTCYPGIAPAVYIAYNRTAYYGNGDPNFRVTFDRDIIWRNKNLRLSSGVYGENLLDDDVRLMEVKIGKAVPLWLAEVLSNMEVYKTSFSKYGRIYQQMRHNSYAEATPGIYDAAGAVS
ncbi:MAG: polyphosphate polymerase domain-containing protein [Christensenella sp.]|nr:polyphosphate polymerase domain-containing protein [Christensenella sp.]